ncbi:CBS domain-containing protein [Neolewinella antarctica]|uniref:CBS-domain-containing membrane protein n=1 Tax=Neolewinella antarctica TaxID=442734 RepID=A0ABX0XDT2_9BACT|nr:CBS domain-containing protein [Neolewinella antarctica]NJC27245.1 CBS-domain-containing membrane protein [Neolewinella antarctica]
MMNEEVRSIMSTRVTTVLPQHTVGEVLKIMQRKRLQQLPVVDDYQRLVGIITSYDLWQNCQQRDYENTLVGQLMNKDVVKLAPKDKVGTAAELFMDRRFKTLPVVNLDNKLKGVVTAFDVIRYSFKKEYPEPILYGKRLQ